MGLESELMAAKDAAELWGITPRRVQILCDNGKVSGAVRMGRTWIIPRSTPKPIDGRTKAAKTLITPKIEDDEMNIKMIVTDLDGTLLRDDKTVSERNKLALSRCRELGIKVVFATGRSYRTKIVPQDWFDGHVRSNGAYAYAGETIVYQRIFSEETIRHVFDACNQRGITTERRLDEQIHLPSIKPTDAEYVNSMLPPDLYLVVLKEGFGQVMHKEAKKANAIEALARHWGIDKSETVVFDDDLNDVNMLSWAGNGVAMGNALEEVKAVADYICDTNDNDGVAKWLEENVLCN